MTTVQAKCKHKDDRILIAGMLALYGLLLLGGCSTANYGGLKRSRDVAGLLNPIKFLKNIDIII